MSNLTVLGSLCIVLCPSVPPACLLALSPTPLEALPSQGSCVQSHSLSSQGRAQAAEGRTGPGLCSCCWVSLSIAVLEGKETPLPRSPTLNGDLGLHPSPALSLLRRGHGNRATPSGLAPLLKALGSSLERRNLFGP